MAKQADKKAEGNTSADQATFRARHKTKYPKYRRGGMVFTRQMAEYSTDQDTLKLLLADAHLDVKVDGKGSDAAGESSGTGETGKAGSKGGDSSGDSQ